MPQVSGRALGFPSSPIRKLVRFAEQAKQRGNHVHHLNIGQPDIRTPSAMLDAIRAFDAEVLAYGPAAGLPELRQAISGYFLRSGVEMSAENVFVTTGGSEAICFALAAVADPGDEILVPEPYYANYAGFAAMLGLRLVAIPASAGDGFHLPEDSVIESCLTERTRAFVNVNPGNPTGTVYRREEVERLTRLIVRRGLFLVSDEVYREFVYGDTVFTSALEFSEARDHVIVTDSISKRFSACGARIGCLVTQNEGVRDAVTKMGFARLCPPTLGQLGAIAGYALPPSYFDEVVAEYQSRRDLLIPGLNGIPGVSSYRPEGAFYAIVSLPVDDTDRFCQWILADFSHAGETVMLAPATGFYSDAERGRREARIAYVLEKPALARSLEILEAALRVYPGRIT